MRSNLLPSLLFTGVSALVAQAQDFDPVKSAKGWSRLDRDGSATFYDPGTQKLYSWGKEMGIFGDVDLSKTGLKPEFWVVDSYGHAWVISGTTAQYVEKTGKLGASVELPASVADVAWDAKALYLSYTGEDIFIEKRDLRTGAVLWTHGSASKKGVGRKANRIAVNTDGTVVVAAGSQVHTHLLDAKGKLVGQTFFTLNDGAPPDLALGTGDRGPLMNWGGKPILLAGIPGSQVASVKMNGTLVAKLDLTGGTIEFLPSGLTEDHTLIGATDSELYFISAKGGLGFAPIR